MDSANLTCFLIQKFLLTPKPSTESPCWYIVFFSASNEGSILKPNYEVNFVEVSGHNLVYITNQLVKMRAHTKLHN